MTITNASTWTAALFLASSITTFLGEEIGGIEFPQGTPSFADQVVEYDPAFSGGAVPTNSRFTDPARVLGVPDYSGGEGGTGSVSLGSGGRLVIRFTNNKLTGSDSDAHDLHIFEVGSDVEDTFVEISADGVTWHDIGKVFGSTSSIDIDAFGFDSQDEFVFVRLTDDPAEGNTSGDTVGADIDAIGAISTSPVQDTPDLFIETAVVLQFQSALGSVYTIQESTDLDMANWTDSVTDIQGDGSLLRFFFAITTPSTFYRLKPSEE